MRRPMPPLGGGNMKIVATADAVLASDLWLTTGTIARNAVVWISATHNSDLVSGVSNPGEQFRQAGCEISLRYTDDVIANQSVQVRK